MADVTRTGLTALAARGSDTTYTISHAGGSAKSTFVHLYRFSAVSPSGITYGGVSMTKLISQANANNHVNEIWGLNDCPTGTQDIVITCPAAEALVAGAVSYKNVNHSLTFPNVSNSGINLLTSLTVSVTTTTDDCILLGLGSHLGLVADSHAAGADTVDISYYDAGSLDMSILESDPLKTGTAGSKSMEITLGNSGQDMCLAVIALSHNLSSPKFFRQV